jgi:hypothetical protein
VRSRQVATEGHFSVTWKTKTYPDISEVQAGARPGVQLVHIDAALEASGPLLPITTSASA